MTKEEYLSAKAKLNKEFEKLNKEFEERHKQLDMEFALSNNDVEIGDIVADKNKAIRVENISVFRSVHQLPYVYFIGTRLTKKLEPFKSGEKTSVFNVEKHIRK